MGEGITAGDHRMKLHLYLVVADDEDGNNCDLLVVAYDPGQAKALWQLACKADGVEVELERIFLLPVDPKSDVLLDKCPRVLRWYTDVREVTP